MARVIRYNGNLMARVSSSENTFFSQLLQYLLREKTITSSLHNGKYTCENINGFSRMVILVKKVGMFYRGEKAPVIPEPKEERLWASQTP
jgi:hypothetical protein